mgnify:FL=1
MRQMNIRSARALPGAGKPAHYSDEWYTPAEIPAAIGGFDLDPCAGPSSHASVNWRSSEGADGLNQPWSGRVWLNPPYSNVHDWMERLISHNDGVALVNARPETQWFQRAASKARVALWLRRRIDFARPDGKVTHPPRGQRAAGLWRERCGGAAQLRSRGHRDEHFTPILTHGIPDQSAAPRTTHPAGK